MRALTLAIILLATFFCRAQIAPTQMRQDAYVWQRAWTVPVQNAVKAHGTNFSELIALAGEINWKGGRPVLTSIPLPYDALREEKAEIGLALRIAAIKEENTNEDSRGEVIANIAASLVNAARTNGVRVAELQMDYDCADSKLPNYCEWLRVIKRALAPTRVSITALPSWLNQSEFSELAAMIDGYVLQVHSLERPKSFNDPFTLCKPDATRASVKKASEIGIPFRVALPTYGYVLAFATDGRFVGLSAEGPSKSWPSDAKLREVRADPLEIAGLVSEWARQPPPFMRGVIWYRFPTPDDVLNWRWPTLDAIIHLRLPHERIRAEARRVEAGLYEIHLVNQGDLDISSRLAVEVHWKDARMMAGDGVRDFELTQINPANVKLQSKATVRLRAGDEWLIGWIRLTQLDEVTLEIKEE